MPSLNMSTMPLPLKNHKMSLIYPMVWSCHETPKENSIAPKPIFIATKMHFAQKCARFGARPCCRASHTWIGRNVAGAYDILRTCWAFGKFEVSKCFKDFEGSCSFRQHTQVMNSQNEMPKIVQRCFLFELLDFQLLCCIESPLSS